MSRRAGADEQAPPVWRTDVVESLRSARCRRLLRALLARSGTADVAELATAIVADEREAPPADVNGAEARDAERDLVHSQLPRLERAELVTWDRADGAVATTDHPAYADATFRHLLAMDADEADLLLAALGDARRRLVLAVLGDHGDAMDRRELASAVRARERASGGGDASDPRPDTDGSSSRPGTSSGSNEPTESVADGGNDEVGADEPSTDGDEEAAESADHVRAMLHHVHLPKLDDCGLVEYDPEGGSVTYVGHPVLDEPASERPGDAQSVPEHAWTADDG